MPLTQKVTVKAQFANPELLSNPKKHQTAIQNRTNTSSEMIENPIDLGRG